MPPPVPPGPSARPGPTRGRAFTAFDLLAFAVLSLGITAAYLRRSGSLTFSPEAERGTQQLVELIYLGVLVIAGWAALRLIRAARALVVLIADHAHSASLTAELIENQIVPGLIRIAEALERGGPPSPAAGEARAGAIREIRGAIEEGHWDRAEALIKALVLDHPGAPEAPGLSDEVASGRRAAIDDLKSRLDAARSVNDPEAALGLRDELAPLLRQEARAELDRDVLRWLMGLIQKRMRAGAIRPDVVRLASRVSESFAATPEGASLRASLPTLRRSAGLCAECGEPYSGIEDACPKCTGEPEAPGVEEGTEPGRLAGDAPADPPPDGEDRPAEWPGMGPSSGGPT
jgi:hypothetical protein